MITRKIISGTGLVIGIILFIASVVFVNSLVTNLRVDLTENKLFTLSQGTINILEKLDEPISLKFYFSQNELTGFNPTMLNYGVRGARFARRVRGAIQRHAGTKHYRSRTLF